MHLWLLRPRLVSRVLELASQAQLACMVPQRQRRVSNNPSKARSAALRAKARRRRTRQPAHQRKARLGQASGSGSFHRRTTVFQPWHRTRSAARVIWPSLNQLAATGTATIATAASAKKSLLKRVMISWRMLMTRLVMRLEQMRAPMTTLSDWTSSFKSSIHVSLLDIALYICFYFCIICELL